MTRLPGRSIIQRISALAICLAPAACHTSPAPSVVARADTQRGATVLLRMVDGAAHSGELLAVRDSTLVLLTNGRVATASLTAVESLDLGEERVPTRGTAAAALLDRARGASRFPFGIPPNAMTALLQRAGQNAPLELRAGTP